MVKLVYLSCLLAAAGSLVLLDLRYKLAFWRSPRRAAALVGAGLLYFLAWDICGIRAKIFYIGNGHVLTGLHLLPNLPVEELIFLTLLMYQAILLWELLGRRR